MKTAFKNTRLELHKQSSYQVDKDHLLALNVTYHGRHNDGRYRIKINGKKALSTGTLYELYPKANADGVESRHIGTTPEYKAGLPDEQSLIAIGANTQSKFLLIGTLEYLESMGEPKSPRTEDAKTQDPQVDSPLFLSKQASVVTVESTPSVVENKKIIREQRKLAGFVRELGIIKVQCDAGFDPPISIPATGFISKRSAATTYRDIQKGILPKPIKIGRNSTFPYSIAKAYADGQLIGGVV